MNWDILNEDKILFFTFITLKKHENIKIKSNGKVGLRFGVVTTTLAKFINFHHLLTPVDVGRRIHKKISSFKTAHTCRFQF